MEVWCGGCSGVPLGCGGATSPACATHRSTRYYDYDYYDYYDYDYYYYDDDDDDYEYNAPRHQRKFRRSYVSIHLMAHQSVAIDPIFFGLRRTWLKARGPTC